MSFKAADLVSKLRLLEREPLIDQAVQRFVVALSGGLDSTVLLHGLATTREQHGRPLLAVHIDHQLHPESQAWARQCEAMADELGVEFTSRTVAVDAGSGQGPEASAREARYAAFLELVGERDCLLSAHHRDDQAETLLLNVLRGSGPAGVAGIPVLRRFGAGYIARPLLDVPRDALEQYARHAGLHWIEDPSNDESRFDRNFLRNEVLPVIRRRWPDAGRRLGRSASLARDATGLLQDLADIDLASVSERPDRLNLSDLRALTPSRQANLLRRATALARLPAAPAKHLDSIIQQLIPARDDAAPLVSWSGAEVRRYREHVYLLPAAASPAFAGLDLKTGEMRHLGSGLGSLSLDSGDGPGLSEHYIQQGLELRVRQGGEQLKPLGQQHTRKLKKLLQEEGVVPWMRDRLPLVFSGDELVAVADLWIDSAAAADHGIRIRWQGRPALH